MPTSDINNGNYINDPSADSVYENFNQVKSVFTEYTKLGGFEGTSQDLKDQITASANGVIQFQTLAEAVAYYDANTPADYTRFDVRNDSPNNGEYVFLDSEPNNYLFQNGFGGSKTNLITLANPTLLTELNAITGMSEGDLAVVTNYLNDKVTFIYDGTNWIRAKAQEFNCVVRYNETTSLFEFVDDAAHTPLGTTGINTDSLAGFQFSVAYPEVTTIGSVIAGVDEEFARRGFFIGASVAKSESFFRVMKQGFNVRFVFSSSLNNLAAASDSGNLLKSEDFTVVHDATTGETTISHPTIVAEIDRRAIVYDNGNVLRPFVKSFTSTSVVVTWWKWSDGTQQLALSSSMKMIYEQKGTYRVPNERISAAGNFWIKGTHYTD